MAGGIIAIGLSIGLFVFVMIFKDLVDALVKNRPTDSEETNDE